MKIGKKLLAFILSLGCVGAFAACDMGMLNSMLGGGTSDLSSGNVSSDLSSESLSSENSSSDGINSGNTEQPKGKQVTEEEWKAALSATVNATNVSQSMCYTFEYTDGTANRSYESYMLLQENATYQYGVQNGTPYQQYYARVEGVDYQYTVNGDVWTRTPMNREMTYTNYQMASTLDPMQAIYADFTFNEEKGVYTCAEVVVELGEGSTQTMYNAEFGFENGQLVHFYYEITLTNSEDVENGIVRTTLKYWDYGETSFDLPEIQE